MTRAEEAAADQPVGVVRDRLIIGGGVPAEVFRPDGTGPRGAVVLGAEAMGPNGFSTSVATRLAAAGHVVAVPDYLRGDGPPDPDDYLDLDAVRDGIRRLDFRRATRDLGAAITYLRSRADVDPARVGVWGYCTGGTLALLAACLDPSVAAAVLFYPSQLVFDELDDRRPVHPIDLLWALRCPTVAFYGDADSVLPPDRRVELARRLDEWADDARLVIYPGAEHVFAGPMPGRHRPDYDADSWSIATALVERALA